MNTRSLSRVFKSGATLFPDPAPHLAAEESLRLYPQFAQATVKGPVQEGDHLVFTVDKLAVGTKG